MRIEPPLFFEVGGKINRIGGICFQDQDEASFEYKIE
jgi:hypothetical protein